MKWFKQSMLWFCGELTHWYVTTRMWWSYVLKFNRLVSSEWWASFTQQQNTAVSPKQWPCVLASTVTHRSHTMTLLSLYLQHYQKRGAPLSELQAFIAECKDPPDSGKFMVHEESSGAFVLLVWIAPETVRCSASRALLQTSGSRSVGHEQKWVAGIFLQDHGRHRKRINTNNKTCIFWKGGGTSCNMPPAHVTLWIEKEIMILGGVKYSSYKGWCSIQLTYVLLLYHLLYGSLGKIKHIICYSKCTIIN